MRQIRYEMILYMCFTCVYMHSFATLDTHAVLKRSQAGRRARKSTNSHSTESITLCCRAYVYVSAYFLGACCLKHDVTTRSKVYVVY